MKRYVVICGDGQESGYSSRETALAMVDTMNGQGWDCGPHTFREDDIEPLLPESDPPAPEGGMMPPD